MAQYDASKVRAVAIEMQEKVISLHAHLLPIVTAVSNWTLNDLDPTLPLPFTVRIQLEAYSDLTKETLRLSDWIAMLKEAQPGDSLTYPPPPASGLGVYFDETLIFDQTLIF